MCERESKKDFVYKSTGAPKHAAPSHILASFY